MDRGPVPLCENQPFLSRFWKFKIPGNLKFGFLKFGLSRRASSNASATARVLDFWHLRDFRLPSPFAGDGARTKKILVWKSDG